MADITKLNTSYLRFDAYSMKELLMKKLSEDSSFTDFLYEGSNLTILIDICANIYQSLMFNLNNSAAESMFADTQIYENINRLVKFIGYNPRGYSTSSASVLLTGLTADNSILLPYTTINTGKKDSTGKSIYFSTVDYWNVYDSDIANTITVYNGIWKQYTKINIADGSDYETFVLTGLVSDSVLNKYVAYPYVHAYIKRYDTLLKKHKYIKFTPVLDGLFLDNDISNGVKIYGPTENIYELRLNEYKQYELKFGNGINGSKLQANDEIYVFYLDSNGPDGELMAYDITDKGLLHDAATLGMTNELYNGIFVDILPFAAPLTNMLATNLNKSSSPAAEETVDSIRTNAPNFNKTLNRLITATDFSSFIKSRFYTDIVDIVAMNNYEYICSFYKWLYNIGIKNYNDGKHYINSSLYTKYDYKYADAADSNNVYLWIKMKNDANIYAEQINAEIVNIKTLTSEPVYLKPVNVSFIPCAAPTAEAIAYFADIVFDKNNENYIEVTIDNKSMYTPELIKSQIINIIIEYFDESNHKIGDTIDFNTIYNNIMLIDGINRVRTVYNPTDGHYPTTIVNGLSFASFSTDILTPGDDINVSNISFTLEKFQFPKLYSKDLTDRLVIIKENINNVTRVQY